MQFTIELPKVNYTVITIAGEQMGVGGVDSWGAPVHKEYTIITILYINVLYFVYNNIIIYLDYIHH